LPVFSQEPLPLVNMNFQRPGGLGEYDPSKNPQGISIPQPRLDFEIMFAWVPGGMTAPSAAPPLEGQPVAQNQ
jgi:hypothetical protein